MNKQDLSFFFFSFYGMVAFILNSLIHNFFVVGKLKGYFAYKLMKYDIMKNKFRPLKNLVPSNKSPLNNLLSAFNFDSCFGSHVVSVAQSVSAFGC